MHHRYYLIEWQGLSIELRYWPLKWSTITHQEMRAIEPKRAPLPVTEIVPPSIV